MRRGNKVELKMQKTLCQSIVLDDVVYSCEFLQYDDKEECFYLLTNSTALTTFSLDAIYSCKIQTDTEILQCTGRVKERYCHAVGNVLRVQIINGFFKV